MPKTLSNYNVHRFWTEEEYQDFLDHVAKHIEENSNSFRGYLGLTEVDLFVDDDEEGDLKFMLVRKEIRPGSVDPKWTMRTVPVTKAKELETIIPEMRAEHLPPRNPEVIDRLRFPTTDIASGYDHVLICPDAAEFIDRLEQRGVPVPSFDVVEDDVNLTRNAPIDALSKGARRGLRDTERHKDAILTAKDDLARGAIEAMRHTRGTDFRNRLRSSKVARQTVGAENLLKQYERMVRANGGEHTYVKEVGVDLDRLYDLKRRIDNSINQTEEESVDTFYDVIDEEGMTLPPNTITSADDAINRVGIGRRRFLRLDQ
jgi:hypothetical protein